MKFATSAPTAALAVGLGLGLAAGLAACGGTTGTLAVDLVTAPDSHVLDAVQRLRLTLTEPHQVVEAVRGAAGFDVALELDATSAAGALIVEGFDAGGALVACGQSPQLPLGGINARPTRSKRNPGSRSQTWPAMRPTSGCTPSS